MGTYNVTLNASVISGTPEILTWREYIFGLAILLTCLAILVINVVYLVCFYRLRDKHIVKTAKAVVSLVATDLINALILTPTVLGWFILKPPYQYGTCVACSLPFMLATYIGLLNISSFCMYRIVIIKTVTSGGKSISITRYYTVTVVLWILTPAVIAVPYLLWGNETGVLAECRRSLFGDLQPALSYFAVIFDLPLIVMNISFICLWLWVKRFSAKVTPNSNIETGCTAVPPTSLPSSRDQVHSNNADEVFVDGNYEIHVNTNGHSTGMIIPAETETEFSDKWAYTCMNDEMKSNGRNIYFCAYPGAFESTSTYDLDNGHFNSKQQRQIDFENGLKFKLSDQSVKQVNQPDFVSQIAVNERVHMADYRRPTKLDCLSERNILILELHQSLVTMAILISIYNLTTIPLILDINIASLYPGFYMPNALNSLCFLSALFNPVVYIVRMDKMREEVKRLLSSFRECLCLSGTTPNNS